MVGVQLKATQAMFTPLIALLLQGLVKWITPRGIMIYLHSLIKIALILTITTWLGACGGGEQPALAYNRRICRKRRQLPRNGRTGSPPQSGN